MIRVTDSFHKLDSMYLDIADRISEESSAEKLKVGSVIVSGENIIAFGYNGTPYKFPSNVCEDEDGDTLDVVVHAEENAILKLASSTQSAVDATIYVTHAPCIRCSRMIRQVGIKRVVFTNMYKNNDGIDFLQGNGIIVHRYDRKNNKIKPYMNRGKLWGTIPAPTR